MSTATAATAAQHAPQPATVDPPTSLRFTKLHGLGNDYVYVSTFDQSVADPVGLARVISERHRGVGSDGLILIRPPTDAGNHARMEMYNADGSRGEMCGNGIRCVGKFVYDHGIARSNPLRVETDAGLRLLDLTLDDGGRVMAVRVNMGTPRLAPADIPARFGGDRVVDMPITVTFDDEPITLHGTCVSVGNPHVVFFVPRVADVPLLIWGPALEHHPQFPQRVNVHFVEVRGRDELVMRTWERGSGVTQACGTGACAVLVAAVLNKLADRSANVQLPGGTLHIEWAEAGDLYKTGPAVEVFSGTWPV